MKAFIDTSSLVKRYVAEKGLGELEILLNQISEIIISPTCLLEITSALNWCLMDKTLTAEQVSWVETQLHKDYNYFSKVAWGEDLQLKGIELIHRYHLRTLDCIQLASACVAKADIFITSDKELFTVAKTEIESISLI